MQEQYKHTMWGLFKIVSGISIGIAVGFIFTAVLEYLLDIFNLEDRL